MDQIVIGNFELSKNDNTLSDHQTVLATCETRSQSIGRSCLAFALSFERLPKLCDPRCTSRAFKLHGAGVRSAIFLLSHCIENYLIHLL